MNIFRPFCAQIDLRKSNDGVEFRKFSEIYNPALFLSKKISSFAGAIIDV